MSSQKQAMIKGFDCCWWPTLRKTPYPTLAPSPSMNLPPMEFPNQSAAHNTKLYKDNLRRRYFLCSINSCIGNTCDVSCLYKVWYYAQPTDSGTPWAGDSWTAMVQASDTVFSGVSATSSNQTLLSLLAFETTSSINYGSFNQGQTMSTLTASSVLRASGNVSMNVTVYGSSMTSGAFSIPVGQQHYATSS